MRPCSNGSLREVDARDDVVGAEGDLLGLREEVIDAAIQDQAAHAADGHLFLRNQFGGVQNIELELIGKLVIEKLEPELPFRIVA